MVEEFNLIYTDKNGYDVGVLKEYMLDLAWGADENSFRLTLPIDRHGELDVGCRFYEYAGEIGGKVDAITVDTANRQVIYSGRTWHGILAGKVVAPKYGDAYYIMSGAIGTIALNLINDNDLGELFYTNNYADYQIDNYEARYGTLLDVLYDMCQKNGLKLKLKHGGGGANNKIEMIFEPYVDYSQDEEWASSQRDFVAKEYSVGVNHLVCLGGGELEKRHVIHLYSDGVNIMPYLDGFSCGIVYNVATGIETSDTMWEVYLRKEDLPEDDLFVGFTVGVFPDSVYKVQSVQGNLTWVKNIDLKFRYRAPFWDGDYMLDSPNIEREAHFYRQISGIDEVVEVFDYPNAATIENYRELTNRPYKWDENYANYYQIEQSFEGESYVPVEPVSQERYTVLSSQPADWATNVGNYYQKIGNDYVSVENVQSTYYDALNSQPSDWSTNYGNYYKFSATTNAYEHAEGTVEESYQAIDIRLVGGFWKLSYDQYYTRSWDGTQYVYNRVNGVSEDVYTAQASKPSDWENFYGNYFRKKKDDIGYEAVPGEKRKTKGGQVYYVVPKWKKGKYFTHYTRQRAPVFDSTQTYYKPYNRTIAPTWVAGVYYEQKEITQAPAFAANTYYRIETVEVAPPFGAGYYQRFEDHYADLVANGIKKFEQLINKDEISISLKPDTQYDVGDVVGAVDEITGLSVWKPITKKIVKLNRNKKLIKYEIGGRR